MRKVFHVKHLEDTMTIELAAEILSHRKDHWSHEIADAEKFAQDALIVLATNQGIPFERMRAYLNNKLREGSAV